MNVDALRTEWRRVFGSEPPSAFSRDLLARAIAYRLQEQALGGLSPSAARLLRSLAEAGGRAATSGQGRLGYRPRAQGCLA
ncbi:MAG: DUF2924 domain-containing protein [Rhodoblastus sp.]